MTAETVSSQPPLLRRHLPLPLFANATPLSVLLTIGAALLIFLVPYIPGFNDAFTLLILTTVLINFIVVIGLNILVGFSGQLSLGHIGLFALGAYTSALLNGPTGETLDKLHPLFPVLPVWLSIPLGGLVAGLAGVVLALPALKVRGPYLAMVTIAFSLIILQGTQRWVSMTNGPIGLYNLPIFKPSMFFWMCGFTALVAQIFANNLTGSRIGRTFLALKGSDVAAETVGVNIYRWKVLAFVISAVYAGIGGGLFAYQGASFGGNGYLNSDPFTYDQSIFFLVCAILGGAGTKYGPLIGAAILSYLPLRFADLAAYNLIIYGIVLLFTLIVLPEGILGTIRRVFFANRRPALPKPARDWNVERTIQTDKPLLVLDGVVKQFGGLRAVNRVSTLVTPNTIHALIGPNGAGKSTIVNLITGIYEPTEGTIRFEDRDISTAPPHQVAQLGMTRTFQTTQLFPGLTVLENIMVGYHTRMRAGVWHHLFQTRRAVTEEQTIAREGMALLRFINLDHRGNYIATSLPYGDQRRVEIARALGVEPKLLLLDEPAAGVNPTEVKDLADLIVKIRQHGVTVFVIEHHMDLVMGISDIVTVIDFGSKIAEGTPAEVQRNPKVIEAYLGDTEVFGVHDAAELATRAAAALQEGSQHISGETLGDAPA